MADNNIRFTIGAVFNGEGFAKARKSVSDMNASVKQGANAATQIAAALGNMDASASKAMTAMTGLIGAIATMNAASIAAQGTMLAINFAFDEMKTKAEDLAKRMNEVKAAVERAFEKRVAKYATDLAAELKEIDGGFEQITKRANEFTAALEGVRSATAAGGIADLEIEKLNAMLEAHSDAERQTIEATYNLKKAIEESANSSAAWSVRKEQAHMAVVAAEEKISKIDEKAAAVAEKRAEIDEQISVMKLNDDKRWRELQAESDAMKQKELELQTARIDAESELDILIENEKQAKVDAENAQKKSTAAILQAELAQKSLTESLEERKSKEEIAAKAAKEAAAARKKEADDKDAAAKIQQELNDSASALKQAQEEYAAALKAYKQNYAKNVTNEEIDKYHSENKGLDKAGTIPVKVMNAIQGKVADEAVSDAIRNGLVTSVKEADQLARQAAREARNQATKQFNQQARERQRYERLQQKNRKTWSRDDEKFAATFKQIEEAQKKQKEAVEAAKARIKEEQERLNAIKKAAIDMSKDMKNLDLITKQLEVAAKLMADAVAL